MINYKDKQKITAYIEYIKAYDDADYIGYFLNLTEEEKLKEINNEDWVNLFLTFRLTFINSIYFVIWNFIRTFEIEIRNEHYNKNKRYGKNYKVYIPSNSILLRKKV